MKILHINFSDTVGGAAIAAYRLHKALLKNNVDSNMLVRKKISNDPTVIGPVTKLQKGFSLIRPILDQIPLDLYKSRSKTMFSTAWLASGDIVKRINRMNPDIVHLHWINGGMLKIEDLLRIRAPIVWSLHDMWPFTGGCHYDEECGLYKKSCGTCKVLRSTKKNDLSRIIFKKKENIYSNIKLMTVIGLSKWITKSAKESTLFKNKNVINLPNLIDTDTYKPLDKNYSRDLYDLPNDKKLVLFGAMGATSDPRKGYSLLKDALSLIDNEENELVVFGNTKYSSNDELKYDLHFVGQKYDDESLVSLYSACDVMVVPSIQENLSNTIMESLSCGTPVVAFDIGGNSDMILHRGNGYLAEPFNSNDLATGINWVLSNNSSNELSIAARKIIENSFSEDIIIPKYLQLYTNVLGAQDDVDFKKKLIV